MICREHYLIWYDIAFLSKIAKKANLGLLNLKPKNQNSFRSKEHTIDVGAHRDAPLQV